MSKIILDAMGGDNAPLEIVKGALLALEKSNTLSLVLTGDEAKVRECLSGRSYDPARLQIVHCSEIITNDDAPTLRIQRSLRPPSIPGQRTATQSRS